MPKPALGELAPDFALKTGNGALFTLSEHQGQKVVIFFYPADDTESCTRENIEFTQLASEFAAENTIVVGISPDSAETHRKFSDKYDLGVILAADPEHDAIGAYGVWGEKVNFGKKYMGVIRSTFLIDTDGRVAGDWKVTRVKGHAASVLSAVRALSYELK